MQVENKANQGAGEEAQAQEVGMPFEKEVSKAISKKKASDHLWKERKGLSKKMWRFMQKGLNARDLGYTIIGVIEHHCNRINTKKDVANGFIRVMDEDRTKAFEPTKELLRDTILKWGGEKPKPLSKMAKVITHLVNADPGELVSASDISDAYEKKHGNRINLSNYLHEPKEMHTYSLVSVRGKSRRLPGKNYHRVVPKHFWATDILDEDRLITKVLKKVKGKKFENWREMEVYVQTPSKDYKRVPVQ